MALVLVEDGDGRRLVKDTSYSSTSLTVEKKETDALGNPSWRKEWSEHVPTHLDRTLDRQQQLELRPLSLLLRAISNHEAREARLQRSLDDAQSEVTLLQADLDAARAALAQADELIARNCPRDHTLSHAWKDGACPCGVIWSDASGSEPCRRVVENLATYGGASD